MAPMKAAYANVYEYADFRKYLEEYQLRRQAAEKGFSRIGVCKLLGLPNTRSYFTSVLKGKPVSRTFVDRFIQVLELDKEEAQYFRVLVQFNQAESEGERELLFDQLIAMNRTPKKFVDVKAYAYYKDWIHSAVRAMLDVVDVKDNPAVLARRLVPAVPVRKARESLALLAGLGLIAKNDRGCWKATDRSITAGAYVQHELVKQYQLQSFELGKRAVYAPSGRPRNMSTLTLSLSEKMRDKVFQRLQKFKSEVRSMVHKDGDPATCLYQLNIQLFPQSD
jgi:uncharacterized protein (TIGR02147 family)